MKVLITLGPSYEPVDEVRRLTNFSTGQLGTMLAEHLGRAGHEAICFRGIMATYPLPANLESIPFTTNDDLAEKLQLVAKANEVGAVFHLAALCDYRVNRVENGNGQAIGSAKIPSRAGALNLILEPAKKLIVELRNWFPAALLVGWKYELDGSRENAIEKGRRQILEARTNACVVNGRAYGEGFGFVNSRGTVQHLENREKLCAFLLSVLPTWPRSTHPH